MSLSVCKLQVLCAQVGFFRHAVGFQTAGVLLCNKLPVHIVTVCNPDAALFKQQTLTMRIFFKAPMLVRSDMIRLQICKNTEIEYKALGPVEHQRLRGNLHYNGITARFHHFGKIFLQKIRFRRRIDRVNMRVSDDYFNGSDQSYLSSRIFQDGFYQISGRRLTLRSGDADRRQFFCRMVKPRRRYEREGIAGILHPDQGRFRLFRKLYFLGHDNRSRFFLCSLCGSLMSVKICPLDTDKQTAFYNFSGVINDRRNFFFQISSFTGKGKLTQKLFQCFHEIGLLSDPLQFRRNELLQFTIIAYWQTSCNLVQIFHLKFALHLAALILLCNILPLVVELFAAAETDLHLCAPVLKIDLQRHDRIAFFLTFCGKL